MTRSSTGRWPTAATDARTRHPAGRQPAPVPNAEALFPRAGLPAGEERIIVFQRGPTGDTNEDYNGNGARTTTPASRATRPVRPQPPAGTRCCSSTAIPGSGRRVLRLRRYSHLVRDRVHDPRGRARDLRRPVPRTGRRTTTPTRWRRSDRIAIQAECDRVVRRLGLHGPLQHDARRRRQDADARRLRHPRGARRGVRRRTSATSRSTSRPPIRSAADLLVLLRGWPARVLVRGRADRKSARSSTRAAATSGASSSSRRLRACA